MTLSYPGKKTNEGETTPKLDASTPKAEAAPPVRSPTKYEILNNEIYGTFLEIERLVGEMRLSHSKPADHLKVQQINKEDSLRDLFLSPRETTNFFRFVSDQADPSKKTYGIFHSFERNPDPAITSAMNLSFKLCREAVSKSINNKEKHLSWKLLSEARYQLGIAVGLLGGVQKGLKIRASGGKGKGKKGDQAENTLITWLNSHRPDEGWSVETAKFAILRPNDPASFDDFKTFATGIDHLRQKKGEPLTTNFEKALDRWLKRPGVLAAIYTTR